MPVARPVLTPTAAKVLSGPGPISGPGASIAAPEILSSAPPGAVPALVPASACICSWAWPISGSAIRGDGCAGQNRVGQSRRQYHRFQSHQGSEHGIIKEALPTRTMDEAHPRYHRQGLTVINRRPFCFAWRLCSHCVANFWRCGAAWTHLEAVPAFGPGVGQIRTIGSFGAGAAAQRVETSVGVCARLARL